MTHNHGGPFPPQSTPPLNTASSQPQQSLLNSTIAFTRVNGSPAASLVGRTASSNEVLFGVSFVNTQSHQSQYSGYRQSLYCC